jgi:hypothetical protein
MRKRPIRDFKVHPPGVKAESKVEELVRSQKPLFFVIPAKAGIQSFLALLDSRLRGSDDLEDFLRDHQSLKKYKFLS